MNGIRMFIHFFWKAVNIFHNASSWIFENQLVEFFIPAPKHNVVDAIVGIKLDS